MPARIVSLLVLLIALCSWPTPSAAVETSQSFVAPTIKDFRLDWCRNWGEGCGGPAAELFCREKGFDKATRWSIDPNVGARGIPTLVFGDGRLCQGPNCAGFRVIVCARGVAEAPPPRPKPVIKVLPGTLKVKEKPVIAVEPPKIIKKAVKADVKRKVEKFKFTKLSKFKARKPEAVRLAWINTLRVLKTYPAGASLFKCSGGSCEFRITHDLEIDEKAPAVDLAFSASGVPHAEAGLWQVSYLPFPAFANASAKDVTPPGLVASGQTAYPQGWFSFNAAEAAKKLPAGATEAIFHVRVFPAAGEGNIVGQPSNVMRAFYGLKLPPQEPYKIYAMDEVPGSAPDIRLVKLEVEPFKTVDRWPSGCKTWEETYGEEKDIFEEIGDFFSGAWNWASDAYQWAKDQVIELASILTLDLIPEEVFAFALDTALASMGIPPDIPNLDQLMKEGVDGLAKEMAKAAMTQIPAADLASNVGNLAADVTIEVAASMTEEELRQRLEQEIEKHSRDAILAAANEMQKQNANSGEGKLCTGASFHPVYKVTVVNAGNRDEPNVEISVSAWPVYRGKNWNTSMRRGEQLTLVAVGEPILPGGPFSAPLLTSKQRFDEDMENWYSDVLFRKDQIISVDVTGALHCLGGDPTSQFCERKMKNLHTSVPQKVTSAYSLSN